MTGLRLQFGCARLRRHRVVVLVLASDVQHALLVSRRVCLLRRPQPRVFFQLPLLFEGVPAFLHCVPKVL